MKLKQLQVDNFKGVQGFVLAPDGGSVNVYGANQTGKTTLFDAYTWGLFGIDSLGRTDFDIVPTGSSGMNINSRVVLTFDDEGTEHQLVRSFREKWVTPRGKPKPEYQGNTTDFAINEVVFKKKDYDEAVAEMIPPDLFKLLSVPRHFNEVMKDNVRREMLLALCGVTEDDNRETVGKVETLKKERSAISSQLKDIDSRIKENKANLTDAIQIDDTDYSAKLQELQQKRASATTSQAVTNKKNEIAEVDNKLLAIKNQQTEKIQAQRDKADTNKQATLAQIKEIEDKVSAKRREGDRILDDKTVLEGQKAKLVAEYRAAEAEVFQGTDCCPVLVNFTCSHLAESQAEAEKAWKIANAEKLTKINKDGMALKNQIDELDKQVGAIIQEINKINAPLPKLEKERDKFTEEIANCNEMLKNIEGLPEYTDTLKEKQVLESQLSALSQGKDVDTSGIDQEIIEIEEKVKAQVEARSVMARRQEILDRITALEKEDKERAQKFEEIEQKLQAANDAMRQSVLSFEEQINSRFKHISYRMTKTQVNGEIVDCCDAVSKEGVPYSGMSNSQKIRAGLEVIKAFSEYYQIFVPVWIDNAESCDHLIDLGDLQVISLIVSGEDKGLRVERG